MARFRKITVRMWISGSFTRLSPLRPSGQALWLYLLTNPDTVSIPGLYRAGEAQMAESLGWSIRAFRKAFDEVCDEGMAYADWRHRVVWIPRAIQHDPPQSANAVKGWAKWAREIPDCDLKAQAHASLKAFVEGMSNAFSEAFNHAWPEASGTQDSGLRIQDPPKSPKGDSLLRRLRRGGSPPDGHPSWGAFFGDLARANNCSAEDAKARWISEREDEA